MCFLKLSFLLNLPSQILQVKLASVFFLRMLLQSNLSIADMLYNGHLVIADTFLRNRPNHGQSLIDKPLYNGHFYGGHLL